MIGDEDDEYFHDFFKSIGEKNETERKEKRMNIHNGWISVWGKKSVKRLLLELIHWSKIEA